MSYGKDPDILIRGVGAIASRDAGSVLRLRRRIARARATRARDVRVSRLALGAAPVQVPRPEPTWSPTSGPTATTGGDPGTRPVFIPPGNDGAQPGYVVGTHSGSGASGPRGPGGDLTYTCPDGTKVGAGMLCPTGTTGGGDQPVTGGGSSSGGAGVTPMYVCSDGITRVADPSMCPVTVTNAPAPTPEPTPTPSTNPWFIVAGIGALYLLFRDRD